MHSCRRKRSKEQQLQRYTVAIEVKIQKVHSSGSSAHKIRMKWPIFSPSLSTDVLGSQARRRKLQEELRML